MSDVTRMLKAIQEGRPQDAEGLLSAVYHELRKIAAARMAREAPGHTLQPTALVHEAWMRMFGPEDQHFKGRAHFLRRRCGSDVQNSGGVGSASAQSETWRRRSTRRAEGIAGLPAYLFPDLFW